MSTSKKLAAQASQEQPQSGGSFIRDPKTGELTLKEKTKTFTEQHTVQQAEKTKAASNNE